MSSVQVRSLAASRGDHTLVEDGRSIPGLDADMRHLLEVLAAMEPKPIERCSAVEARAQPNLYLALRRLLARPPDDHGVSMELRLLPGPAGDIRARIYRSPATGSGGPAPMILYLHGGGWVVGDLEHYDATPRMLARRTGAVVVSAHYRQAPEHKFPAAHEDSFAAWQWMLEAAESLGGDPSNAAVAGEDAGANMALDIAIRARDEGTTMPRHLALVTPMASTDFTRLSHIENSQVRPVSAATVRWYYRNLVRNRAGLSDPRLNPAERGDLGGLPPTTVILAEVDPLRSEGELLAQALRRSGVWVDMTLYEGVTHQFFGMGDVVNKGMFAQGQLARNLAESLARVPRRP
jgi:acetyl esterase